jgi:hypothetical protein
MLFRLILIIGFFLHTRSYHVPVSFSREAVLKPFQEGKAFKVIAGINNFNQKLVENVAQAADVGGASHVDIACDASLVQAAKRVSKIPVCVSSIVPIQFLPAVHAGADMIELGNYDGFYEQGLDFSAETVLSLTKETRELLPHIPLSVTIPHTLPIADQITLAKQLVESYQVDILQTEGKVSMLNQKPIAEWGISELIHNAAPTIASTIALSQAVPHTPILSSSGMTDLTAPIMLSLGAKGVGVGKMINGLSKLDDMVVAVMKIAQAMHREMNTDHPLYQSYQGALRQQKKHVPVLSL